MHIYHKFSTIILLCIIFLLGPTSFLEAIDTVSAQPAQPLNLQMVLLMIVLLLAMVLFIFEWVRVDVVGILMMVLLPLLGLVTAREAISGLSSNAVVSIIAIMIIGAGLNKTGVMSFLARYIIKFAGKSESRLIAVIGGTVGVISSFMQNIGAAALFMPATLRVSHQIGTSASRVLMPMGYCAILGGTITLVGSSPLILLNDLLAMAREPLPPFGLFSVTPVGLALVASGILYFIIFGRFLFACPEEEKECSMMPEDIASTYSKICGVYELTIPSEYEDRRKLDKLKIRDTYFVTIVAIAHKYLNHKIYAPTREQRIFGGDDIAVVGCPDMIGKFTQDYGFRLKDELDTFAEDLSIDNANMLEGIITPRSELDGKTLRDVHFRERYGINPLVLCRAGLCFFDNLSDRKLHIGDALLLFGRYEKFHLLKGKQTFAFTTEVKGEIIHTELAQRAVFWLAISLILILVFSLPLSIALLTGAVGMIISKVLSIDDAYESVDWMTVFLLGGLIPLGIAFENTGAAAYIAAGLIELLGNVSPLMFLLVVGSITSFFTLIISNVGATILLVPLVINMAYKTGIDPRMAALVVGLAASNSFLIPTHQVNALIMKPGNYTTRDFFKAGAGMTILFLLVMVSVVSIFY